MFVEWKIPVLGFLHDGLASADSTFWIDQFGRRKCTSTFLALVTVSTLCVAARTFTGNITVGKECMSFLIVILHGSLFDKFSFVIQFTEEIGSCIVMNF